MSCVSYLASGTRKLKSSGMELFRRKCKTISTVTITVSTVTSIILICLFLLPQSFKWNSILSGGPNFSGTTLGPNPGTASNFTSSKPGFPCRTARELIEGIKEARQLASGKSDDQLASDGNETAEEYDMDEWKRKNPCMSRVELTPMYDKRKHAKKLSPNPLWEELLAEYSKLHRTCLQRVGNLKDYFVAGNTSVAGCQFVVADIAGWTGLGNKIYVSVSSLLYAILTQRVVLIPSATLLPSYTCEPFLGSSWVLDSKTFPVPRIWNVKDIENTQWTYNEDFFREIDLEMEKFDKKTFENIKKGLLVPNDSLENAVTVLTGEFQPNNRFYCSLEQAFYSKLTWVYMSGCIYTVPKLFAAPPFRPILEELFPDNMVMTRLLRSLILPADVVWGRVRRINHAYLADADRRVGIQVRFKDGVDHYNKMNSLVNERIVTCAQNSGFLPRVNLSEIGDSNLSPQNLSSPAPMVKVFVASLFPGLFDHLEKTFVRFPSVTGEDVALVQISQDHQQKLDDVEDDHEAFTEVLLLSLSDQLVVTPISTFGGTAQAYGALTPWFVEMQDDRNLPPCERAQTVDVCDQFTVKEYRCRYDQAVDNKRFSDVVPYIKDCLTIDHSKGIQLITDFES